MREKQIDDSSQNTLDGMLEQGIQDGALSTEELKIIYDVRSSIVT